MFEPLIRALPLHLLAVLMGRQEPGESCTDDQSQLEGGRNSAAAQQLVLPSAYLGRGLKVLMGLSDVALQIEPLATALRVQVPNCLATCPKP